jgi:6-phosphogluconolactonase
MSPLRAATVASGEYLLYVGTYTGPKSKGIQEYRFTPSKGTLEAVGPAAEVRNPSFLALSPDRKYLYAVSELGNKGPEKSSVSSYAIDRKTGSLQFLNKVASGGGGACHLVIDKTQKMLLVANYNTGSVASFRVKADGSLTEMMGFVQHSGSSTNPDRQKGPHAHAVVLSADNRFVFVPDLGTDEIKTYRIDPPTAKFDEKQVASVKLKAGSGPRHFVLHPNNKFAYGLNEMGSSVTTFSYDASQGSLATLQTVSTLPEDFSGTDNSAEIELDKAGKFLYASNRGNDSVTVFSVDRQKGTLTKLQVEPTQGKTPRNFAIDPTGKFLLVANQDSDTIVVFKIDAKSGQLTPTGTSVSAPAPVCLQFVSSR